MRQTQRELVPSPPENKNDQNNLTKTIYNTYGGGSQTQATDSCMGYFIRIMEGRNLLCAFDSFKVRSERHNNQGAAKDPIPFLGSHRHFYYQT
jgi:hypothetical protein